MLDFGRKMVEASVASHGNMQGHIGTYRDISGYVPIICLYQ